MKDMVQELPGLDRVRARFIEMLGPRQETIANHAVLAWDSDNVETIVSNLRAVQSVMHQISGSAGSLGFADLGTKARNCESAIIVHLDGPDADLAICPGDLIIQIDDFVTECRSLLEQQQAG